MSTTKCAIQFLILIGSSHHKMENVSTSYQDTTLIVILIGCFLEYLLLLTYIGVAAYDFFKTRKMMKKMNVQRRTYEFLKFDETHQDVGNPLHNSVLPKASGNFKSGILKRVSRSEMVNAPLQSPSSRGVNPFMRKAAQKKIESQDNPSTHNPQQLKKDAESAPPPVEKDTNKRTSARNYMGRSKRWEKGINLSKVKE